MHFAKQLWDIYLCICTHTSKCIINISMCWEDCKYTGYSLFLLIFLKPLTCSVVFYYSNFASFVKIIAFTKHETRENLNLRNSRDSWKFRETRAHFLDFACFAKILKEFRQKPYVRVPRISQSLHRSLSQIFVVKQNINTGQYVQYILFLTYCMYCEIAYAVRYVQYSIVEPLVPV
jgi:hypothetical protein